MANKRKRQALIVRVVGLSLILFLLLTVVHYLYVEKYPENPIDEREVRSRAMQSEAVRSISKSEEERLRERVELNKTLGKNALKEITSAVLIETIPNNAKIYIDGKYLGQKSPLHISKLRSGMGHILEVKKKGYSNYQLIFDVEYKKVKKIKVRLKVKK